MLGIKRDNFSLPEYKAVMREVETLEQQAETLEKHNKILEHCNEDLKQQASVLHGQVQEIEIHNREMKLQEKELISQIEELEVKEKDNQGILAKHDLRAKTLKTILKEVAPETKKMKSAAVPVNNFFAREEYVKVKKADWSEILDAFDRAVSRKYLLETYEKNMSVLEKQVDKFTDQLQKLERFVASKGLEEEFIKFIAPKSMKQRMEEAKVKAMEYNRQRKMDQLELTEKKHWHQEI